MEKFCEIGKLEKKTCGSFQYYVCRGEKKKGNLRYDLTYISRARLGIELPRTFGHYHLKGQVELFEVISGRALFFIQRYKRNPQIIEEAYLIEAREKEKAIIPPDFSITSINPQTRKRLLISNWVSSDIKNDYKYFKKLGGNCYQIILDRNGEIKFKKNKKYKAVPRLLKLRPKKIPPALENLEFLNFPKKFKKLLTIENCYKKI